LGSLRAGLRGSFGAGSSVIQYSTKTKGSLLNNKKTMNKKSYLNRIIIGFKHA
jgi:hypothetical protein